MLDKSKLPSNYGKPEIPQVAGIPERCKGYINRVDLKWKWDEDFVVYQDHFLLPSWAKGFSEKLSDAFGGMLSLIRTIE